MVKDVKENVIKTIIYIYIYIYEIDPKLINVLKKTSFLFMD